MKGFSVGFENVLVHPSKTPFVGGGARMVEENCLYHQKYFHFLANIKNNKLKQTIK